MKMDFNLLERRAVELFASDRPADALKIYLFMADGDPSLDGDYLGGKIAKCYETLGDLHATKYWYGRAIEESGGARQDCADARSRLSGINIDDLVDPGSYITD